jgi:hypothetical protein
MSEFGSRWCDVCNAFVPYDSYAIHPPEHHVALERIAELEARPDCDKCEKWQVERIGELECKVIKSHVVICGVCGAQHHDTEPHICGMQAIADHIAELEAEVERFHGMIEQAHRDNVKRMGDIPVMTFEAYKDDLDRRWKERT